MGNQVIPSMKLYLSVTEFHSYPVNICVEVEIETHTFISVLIHVMNIFNGEKKFKGKQVKKLPKVHF